MNIDHIRTYLKTMDCTHWSGDEWHEAACVLLTTYDAQVRTNFDLMKKNESLQRDVELRDNLKYPKPIQPSETENPPLAHRVIQLENRVTELEQTDSETVWMAGRLGELQNNVTELGRELTTLNDPVTGGAIRTINDRLDKLDEVFGQLVEALPKSGEIARQAIAPKGVLNSIDERLTNLGQSLESLCQAHNKVNTRLAGVEDWKKRVTYAYSDPDYDDEEG